MRHVLYDKNDPQLGRYCQNGNLKGQISHLNQQKTADPPMPIYIYINIYTLETLNHLQFSAGRSLVLAPFFFHQTGRPSTRAASHGSDAQPWV